jgi:hypothetical protein
MTFTPYKQISFFVHFFSSKSSKFVLHSKYGTIFSYSFGAV